MYIYVAAALIGPLHPHYGFTVTHHTR